MMSHRIHVALLAGSILAAAASTSCRPPASSTDTNTETRRPAVTVDLRRPGRSFVPSESFGADLDGLREGDVASAYSTETVRQMQTAGFGPVSYHIRTELGVQAWHWNPKGTWSDPENRQGYWTSSDRSDKPILVSNGYALPRRGNTFDHANGTGYSRLDDGDEATFWKSNPYLTSRYTKEPDSAHPQWVVVQLGDEPAEVSAVRIKWGTPHAVDYRIQYWDTGEAIYFNKASKGRWHTFSEGTVAGGKGGDAVIRLGKPVSTRFVRILMTRPSNTSPPGSQDVRDGLGYAIREVYVGDVDEQGRFRDLMRHAADSEQQTPTYASSTDPWHREVDKDPEVEQPGFDLVWRSGLTHGLPVMMSVPVVYDTPENAAAEVRYLKRRGYDVRQIEMGEEPDGQYIRPEDYAALYLQWARAIHRVDPKVQLGGPTFQSDTAGWAAWPDEGGDGEIAWIPRFLRYLRRHDALDEYRFFAFEWFPYDEIEEPAKDQLIRAPGLLSAAMRDAREDGLPRNIPWTITEYGYSAFRHEREVTMPGAIMNAEIMVQFLAEGGDATYLFGWPPAPLRNSMQAEDSYGALTLFLADQEGRIVAKLPTYWAARLVTHEWARPGTGRHRLWAGETNILTDDKLPVVTSYATERGDGTWSILLLNKDDERAHSVSVRFKGKDVEGGFQGKADVYSYSPQQYEWTANGENGRPAKALPPAHTVVDAGDDERFELPPLSITVIRGRLPADVP